MLEPISGETELMIQLRTVILQRVKVWTVENLDLALELYHQQSNLVLSSEWNDHRSSPWKIVPSSNQFLRNQLNHVIVTTTEKERIHKIFIHRRWRWRMIVWNTIHHRCVLSWRHWWISKKMKRKYQRIEAKKKIREELNALIPCYNWKLKEDSRETKGIQDERKILSLLSLRKWIQLPPKYTLCIYIQRKVENKVTNYKRKRREAN